MTPEEVFARLRDIHMPEIPSTAVAGMDPRPLMIFGGVIAALVAARIWSRLRRAQAQLRSVDSSSPPATQRDQIAGLFRSVPSRAPRSPVPQDFFAPPWRLTTMHIEELKAWARDRLR